MTKLSLILTVLFLGVACGQVEERAPRTQGPVLSKPDRPEPRPSEPVLYVCPGGHFPNLFASALIQAVDDWADAGELVAVSCDADGAIQFDSNHARCELEDGGYSTVCADDDGIHVYPDRVTEGSAYGLFSDAIGYLLGACSEVMPEIPCPLPEPSP